MSYYGSLCTQMYELDKPNAPEEELAFYMSYAKGKDIKILEPMCGSGRFLLPFAEQGFHIDGFDISKDMLEVCREKCEKRGLKVNLLNVSMEDFSTDEEYDLIMLPGGSFTVLIEDGIVTSSLNKFKSMLAPGGTLLIEALTPIVKVDKSDVWVISNRKVREDGKLIIESSKSDYDEQKKVILFPLKYELFDGDNLLESEYMDLQIRLYEIDEIEELIRNSGFENVRAIKAYNRNEVPTKEDDTVIFECRK